MTGAELIHGAELAIAAVAAVYLLAPQRKTITVTSSRRFPCRLGDRLSPWPGQNGRVVEHKGTEIKIALERSGMVGAIDRALDAFDAGVARAAESSEADRKAGRGDIRRW